MPNFLIVGTTKGGTTSLYEYLKQHPQIYMSPMKELRFLAIEGQNVNFSGPWDDIEYNRYSIRTL
ncbi:MAG: sulfotransferase, partial [Cyanobacteriota bacterium]|nr:sulfotransferase [Cyanobacteriota bacterium]